MARMGFKEALHEAHKRWGSAGAVERRPYTIGVEPGGATHVVGTKGALAEDIAYGIGDSWEEAFADADRRAAESARSG